MSKLTFKGKHGKQDKKGWGFYVAFSICFLAIAAAAITTYNSVKPLLSRGKQDNNVSEVYQAQENHKAPKEDEKDPSSFSFFENGEDANSESKKANENVSSIETKADNAGIIVSPTDGEIIKKYSAGNPIFSKTFNDWRAHNGIDIKADQGSKVKSITDGTVKEIYEDPLLGNTIVIDHNGEFVAYYSGLGNTTMVNANDKVEAGQDIGSINDIPSEKEDGYHLHLAIKKDDSFVDPTDVLGKT